jgi:hypothetical protein
MIKLNSVPTQLDDPLSLWLLDRRRKPHLCLKKKMTLILRTMKQKESNDFSGFTARIRYLRTLLVDGNDESMRSPRWRQ